MEYVFCHLYTQTCAHRENILKRTDNQLKSVFVNKEINVDVNSNALLCVVVRLYLCNNAWMPRVRESCSKEKEKTKHERGSRGKEMSASASGVVWRKINKN